MNAKVLLAIRLVNWFIGERTTLLQQTFLWRTAQDLGKSIRGLGRAILHLSSWRCYCVCTQSPLWTMNSRISQAIFDYTNAGRSNLEALKSMFQSFQNMMTKMSLISMSLIHPISFPKAVKLRCSFSNSLSIDFKNDNHKTLSLICYPTLFLKRVYQRCTPWNGYRWEFKWHV